jgi:hypothetical protein
MDRTWSVEIAAKKHLIEVEYNRNTTRTGNEAQTWNNSQWLDLPKKIRGRRQPAVLRERGYLQLG